MVGFRINSQDILIFQLSNIVITKLCSIFIKLLSGQALFRLSLVRPSFWQNFLHFPI